MGDDRKKKGNISGSSATFPLFQASGHCASSEAISATRKWVTIKEERYDRQLSLAVLATSTLHSVPLLSDLAFMKQDQGVYQKGVWTVMLSRISGSFRTFLKNYNHRYLFQISAKGKQTQLSPWHVLSSNMPAKSHGTFQALALLCPKL